MEKTKKQKAEIEIYRRWMIRRDMVDVLEIEALSFEFRWTEEDFVGALRKRNCIGRVAEHGEYVIGFMLYELYKKEFRLVNFAVHPSWRRNGVGAGMIREMIRKLGTGRRTAIVVDVRETNLQAQLFFRSFGFRAVDVLRGFYEDSNEDAYRMEYWFKE